MYRMAHLRLMNLGVILAVAMIGTSAARAATAAELLEKAIYTEETVGDLDQAIELYEEVIAQAATARKSAAQAQYRLGRIYQKQGKQQQAVEAFEALIANYPGERELVAKAREELPRQLDLVPVPWGDGDALQLNMKLATGLDAGTHIYKVEALEHEGAEVWKCSTLGLVTLNGAQSYSTVLCQRDGFAPISSYWMHSLLGTARADYTADKVTVTQLADNQRRTIDLENRVFDNEQCAELFRRLPLAVGYQTTVPIVSSLGAARVDLGLEVAGKETIEVPAGKFECFKLVLSVGQEFWISADEKRYLVRFQAGGVTADLSKIYSADQRGQQDVKGSHFSLVLPDGWFTYAPQSPDGQQKETMHLLDPASKGLAELTMLSVSAMPEEHRKSVQAWSKDVIAQHEKRLGGFQLVGDLESTEIAGRPATRVVATFSEGEKKKTFYSVGVLGENHAVRFRVITAADDFSEYREAFDKIVDSLDLQ